MVEATRVAIRNIRRDMNEKLKKMEKDKTLSKDDLFKLQEDVQKMTDRYISLSESIYSEKEKEILQF
jgi:ribosome recycling factor